MITVVLAACLGPLLFDLDGPPCPPVKEWLQCACSEGMKWNAVEGATWYEIRRVDQRTGQEVIVGTTAQTHWWYPHDTPLPVAGRLYEYYIRGCRLRGEGQICSENWSNRVRYTASPLLCVKNGQSVPCFPDNPWLVP